LTEKPEKSNTHITILGFKNVKIENINDFLEHFRTEKVGAAVQFFDAKHVAGPQHLYFVALNALNAFEKKTNISNSLAVEALLYASAQRQIKKAVETLGIKQYSSEVAVLIMTENKREKDTCTTLVSNLIPGEQDDNVLELTDKKIKTIKKLFRISNLEFEAKLKKKGLEKEALTDLVIERVALLVTKS
jgi:tRNA threonylcarbamoyladenosine modification (KEOPS) complex Cgi121 subunit